MALESTELQQEPSSAGHSRVPSAAGKAGAMAPSRPRVAALSFGRFLKKGCLNSPMLAALSPRCPAVPHRKVQPLGGREQQLQQNSTALSSFFQIKMDVPLESRICPIDSEGEDGQQRPHKDSAKEVICPWESPTEQGRAG